MNSSSDSSLDVPLFLSDAELVALTGYRRVGDQCKWLSGAEWRFAVSRVGRPIVSRAYCEQRLGAVAEAGEVWSPNLAAIRSAA